MKNYLDLLREVLVNGERQPNRTKIDTLSIPGAMLKFDLSKGFPAVTTKKLAFDQVKGELVGFLKGYTSAKQFRDVGCTIWDQNANENEAWKNSPWRKGTDDLGKIYGAQWRGFNQTNSCLGHDQIVNVINSVRRDPTGRRHIVTAWNPLQLTEMALPPCHLLFQLLPNVQTGKLHMTMYQRSCDMFLGIPFNIASYAILLHLFASWTGYKAGTLTMFLADAHIYTNHIDQVKLQLSRAPFAQTAQLCLLQDTDNSVIASPENLLDNLEPDDIMLLDYKSHPSIKAPMAV